MTSTISKALTSSLISCADQRNFDAVNRLSLWLPTEMQQVVKNILKEFAPEGFIAEGQRDPLKMRFIKVFQGNSPLNRIAECMPNIISFLTQTDISSSSRTDSFFLKQTSPFLYEELCKTSFSLTRLCKFLWVDLA